MRPDVKGRPLVASQAGGPDARSATTTTASRITLDTAAAVSLASLPAVMSRRIRVDDTSGCWIGSPVNRDGYARFGGGSLHRAVWLQLVGGIPPGLVLDHREDWGCTSRACCWPAHLKVTTSRENILRGASFSAVNARKAACGRCGAPYDLFNTYFRPDGARDCRACVARRTREYKARRVTSDLRLAA
jgi:hypothetical protein